MRINELPSATSVAQNDVLAIDTSNGTYQVPRSVLAPSPYVATIPTGQWSGSSGDYYITVSASNVTPSSILIPNYDEDSSRYLIGALWCVPGTGSFTIHTSVLPASTVKILVYFLGVIGEAQYQVLSDVYSKSQTDSLLGAKVNTSDIVDNLTSTETQKPLSANMGKTLEEHIQQSTANIVSGGLTAAANVTINNQHKAANGNLRIYTLIFTTTAAITKRTSLVTGFDVQKIAANGVTTFLMWNNSDMDTKVCLLNSDNALVCNDDLPNNYHLRGTIVYLAQ